MEARVTEPADVADSKSAAPKACGFDSHLAHQPLNCPECAASMTFGPRHDIIFAGIAVWSCPACGEVVMDGPALRAVQQQYLQSQESPGSSSSTTPNDNP